VTDDDLEGAGARWQATRAAADIVKAAAVIRPGSDRARVRELLGDPLVVSELARGGESWLYVRADPQVGQLESVSLSFDASGGFIGLDRKPID
jgi:hypothetical protein